MHLNSSGLKKKKIEYVLDFFFYLSQLNRWNLKEPKQSILD